MIFTNLLEDYIGRHRMLRHDGHYLVALSGGPDSVALLRALHSLGYNVEAVHCNFMLRGEESYRDEMFCENLCNHLGILLHRTHFDTDTYARVHKVSIEMAARHLRYHYFEQLRQDIQADGICVAHHQDDQVETVLLNLVRGTGLKGLQGMKPVNGWVLRPMLGVSRQQVMEYLSELGQDYVVDHTNLETEVQRNKIRLEVMPLLQDINPAVKGNILRMTEHLAGINTIVERWLDGELAASQLSSDSYDMTLVRASQATEQVLWHLLSGYGFNGTQVAEMAVHGASPGQWFAQHHVAVIDRDRLWIVDRQAWEQLLPTIRIPEVGTYVFHSLLSSAHELRLGVSLIPVDEAFVIDRRPDVAQLDAAEVRMPLTLRGLAQGDKFMPFGMSGTKLVSDYLTNAKISLYERKQQLVVVDGEGRIVWLVGRRIDARFAIGKSTTKSLVLTVG